MLELLKSLIARSKTPVAADDPTIAHMTVRETLWVGRDKPGPTGEITKKNAVVWRYIRICDQHAAFLHTLLGQRSELEQGLVRENDPHLCPLEALPAVVEERGGATRSPNHNAQLFGGTSRTDLDVYLGLVSDVRQ